MYIRLSASYFQALEKFVKGNRRNALNTKKATKIFKENPKHPGLNLEKLKGSKYWSIRVDKGNRIFFYWINKETALFIDIGKHDKYRKY